MTEEFLTQLREAAKAVEDMFGSRMRERTGLSAAEARVLTVLATGAVLNGREVARLAELAPGTASTALTKLQIAGLVERDFSYTTAGREALNHINEKGRAAVTEVKTIVDEVGNIALSHLDASQRAALCDNLADVAAALT